MKSNNPRIFSVCFGVLGGAWLAGCSATDSSRRTQVTHDAGNQGAAGGGTVEAPDSGPGVVVPQLDSGPPLPTECNASPTEDRDKDGFSIEKGDCNDCDVSTNPGAFDVAGNKIDENCDGTADNEPGNCDEGLAIEADDAKDAAKAMGICKMQTGDSWGLVKARWAYPDGTEASVAAKRLAYCPTFKVGQPPFALARGILPAFGPNVAPRQGVNLVALSSGVARQGYNEIVAEDGIARLSPFDAWQCTVSATPTGFPKDSPSCEAIVKTAQDHEARDGVALELTIRVPSNAHGIFFDFDFYTYEFPDFICSPFNDFFVALLESGHPKIPADRNISFDSKGNPVSVNNALVEVCKANTTTRAGVAACALGTKELEGTGFEGTPAEKKPHAATGWLRTTAPVNAGETIVLRLAVWDMGDERLDATVLLDNFNWVADEGKLERPVTERPK